MKNTDELVNKANNEHLTYASKQINFYERLRKAIEEDSDDLWLIYEEAESQLSYFKNVRKQLLIEMGYLHNTKDKETA